MMRRHECMGAASNIVYKGNCKDVSTTLGIYDLGSAKHRHVMPLSPQAPPLESKLVSLDHPDHTPN